MKGETSFLRNKAQIDMVRGNMVVVDPTLSIWGLLLKNDISPFVLVVFHLLYVKS